MSLLLRNGPFRAAWTGAFLFFLGLYALAIPLPVWLAQLGMADWQVAVVLGTFGASSLVLRPIIGSAADSFGRRWLGGFGAVALAAGCLLGLAARDPLMWLVIRIVQALGYVAFTTAVTALVADLGPAPQRQARLAIFGAGANVAMVVAPAFVLALQPTIGTASVLVLAAGFAGTALVAVAHLPRDEPAHGGPSTRSVRVPRELWLPMALAIMFGLSWGAFYQFLPLLTDRRGLGSPALLYAIYGVGIIATRVAAASRLADERWPLGWAFGLLALGCGLLAAAQNEALLVGAIALLAVGSGLAHPALLALHADRDSRSMHGRAIATFYLGFDLGIGAGAWMLAPVLQLGGLASLFAAAAAVALMAGLASRRLGVRAPSPQLPAGLRGPRKPRIERPAGP